MWSIRMSIKTSCFGDASCLAAENSTAIKADDLSGEVSGRWRGDVVDGRGHVMRRAGTTDQGVGDLVSMKVGAPLVTEDLGARDVAGGENIDSDPVRSKVYGPGRTPNRVSLLWLRRRSQPNGSRNHRAGQR